MRSRSKTRASFAITLIALDAQEGISLVLSLGRHWSGYINIDSEISFS